jgi:hypothetical protein
MVVRHWGSHIFLDNRFTDGSEVFLRASHTLRPWRFLVLISVRGKVNPGAILWLEALGQLKNPMTSSGIKPVTFWLVAYCLNQLRYCVWETETICDACSLSNISIFTLCYSEGLPRFKYHTIVHSSEDMHVGSAHSWCWYLVKPNVLNSNWIYWPLTGHNYKQPLHYCWLPHYKSLNTKSSQSISTSLYLATALHNGYSSAVSLLDVSR